MGKTNIAWTDYSLNYIKWFCTKTSPGCKNCYMFPMAKRYKANAAEHPVWRPNSVKDLRKIPSGAFVFVGDMYDQYHEQMPVEWIHNVHNMAAYQRPDLQFQMLTKRIERVAQLAPHLIWPDNLWMGTTVENADYNWRIDYLRDLPAAFKFISFEPLLDDVGEVDLSGIDWAIVGADSGAGRRPFDKQWARNIRTQCRKYDTAFFYKQSSGMKPGTDPTLDGHTYHEFPHGMTPLKYKDEIISVPVVRNNQTTEIPIPKLNTITNANSLDYLRACQSNSVHTLITSPPYWGLRDYDTDPIDWPAMSYPPMAGIPEIAIPAMTASLGQEPDLNSFIGHLVLIFREARRVLHDSGTIWLNMGDGYVTASSEHKIAGGQGHNSIISKATYSSVPHTGRGMRVKSLIKSGLKPKDMQMQPARLALALQADGYYLRSDIIWQKTNGSPASYKDRPTTSHEYVYLFAKSNRYYYDWLAIAEPVKRSSIERANRGVSANHKNMNIPGQTPHGLHKARANGENEPAYAQKNKRSVWTTSTGKFKDAHFATFPEKLIEPMILAGCPPKACPTCLSPYERQTKKTFIRQGDVSPERGIKGAPGQKEDYGGRDGTPRGTTHYETTGWQPTCECTPAPSIPGTVLDPFMGSGTIAIVAKKNGRNYMGCDLNNDYVDMANKRLAEPIQTSMFHGDKIPTVI